MTKPSGLSIVSWMVVFALFCGACANSDGTPDTGAAGSSAAVSTASEGEVVAALQALGYSLGEAREASRLALNDATVGAGLEERVKAALRTLLRD